MWLVRVYKILDRPFQLLHDGLPACMCAVHFVPVEIAVDVIYVYRVTHLKVIGNVPTVALGVSGLAARPQLLSELVGIFHMHTKNKNTRILVRRSNHKELKITAEVYIPEVPLMMLVKAVWMSSMRTVLSLASFCCRLLLWTEAMMFPCSSQPV